MSYIKGDIRNQTSVFPVSFDELIAEDNPVRVIDLFIDGLDMIKLGFISTGKSI